MWDLFHMNNIFCGLYSQKKNIVYIRMTNEMNDKSLWKGVRHPHSVTRVVYLCHRVDD